MATQVVIYHVARTPNQVTHGAEHGTIAHTPYVEKIVNQPLEGEAHMLGWHATLWADAATKAIFAVLAHVICVVDSRNCYRLFSFHL